MGSKKTKKTRAQTLVLYLYFLIIKSIILLVKEKREMTPMLFPFCMRGNSKEQMIIFVEMIDKRTYTRW
jgi:hypothetical protein